MVLDCVMPISFRDLLAGEATSEIEYAGETIHLTYNPAAITDSTYRDLRAMVATSTRVTQQAQQSQEAQAGATVVDADAPIAPLEQQASQGLAILDDILS